MDGRTNNVTPWASDGAKEATVTHLSVEFVRPGREKGVARGRHVFGLRHVYWGELVTWNTCHNDKVIYWQLISLLVYRLLVILQWLLKEKLCWKYSGRTLRDQSHLENLSSSRPGCSLRSPSGRVLRTWSGSSAEFLRKSLCEIWDQWERETNNGCRKPICHLLKQSWIKERRHLFRVRVSGDLSHRGKLAQGWRMEIILSASQLVLTLAFLLGSKIRVPGVALQQPGALERELDTLPASRMN